MSKSNPIINIENTRIKSALAAFLGAFFIIAFSLLIGMLGNEQYRKSKEYYEVTFQFDYIENILPGTVVRYQGALIVGSIDRIDHDLATQQVYATAKIKKDFRIPVTGSSISVKTWGYMGQKFINVEVLEPFYHYQRVYEDADIIFVETTPNVAIIMQDLMDSFSDEGNLMNQSIVDKNLLQIRKAIKQAKRTRLFLPRVARQEISQFAIRINQILKTADIVMLDFNQFSDERMTPAQQMTDYIREFLPNFRLTAENLQSALDPANENNTSNLMHREYTYYRALYLSEYYRDFLEDARKEPYRLIYGPP
jgi:hypothetical protein